jgi:hypothetical protein
MTQPVTKGRQWTRLSCAWQGAEGGNHVESDNHQGRSGGRRCVARAQRLRVTGPGLELDDRVGALEQRLDAADARVTQAEAAANQCTTTCQDVEARAQRMIQQSVTK